MDRRLALSALLFSAASVAGDEPKEENLKVPGLVRESEELTEDTGGELTENHPG